MQIEEIKRSMADGNPEWTFKDIARELGGSKKLYAKELNGYRDRVIAVMFILGDFNAERANLVLMQCSRELLNDQNKRDRIIINQFDSSNGNRRKIQELQGTLRKNKVDELKYYHGSMAREQQASRNKSEKEFTTLDSTTDEQSISEQNLVIQENQSNEESPQKIQIIEDSQNQTKNGIDSTTDEQSISEQNLVIQENQSNEESPQKIQIIEGSQDQTKNGIVETQFRDLSGIYFKMVVLGIIFLLLGSNRTPTNLIGGFRLSLWIVGVCMTLIFSFSFIVINGAIWVKLYKVGFIVFLSFIGAGVILFFSFFYPILFVSSLILCLLVVLRNGCICYYS